MTSFKYKDNIYLVIGAPAKSDQLNCQGGNVFIVKFDPLKKEDILINNN